jgi:hypothetical protein
MGVNDLDEVLAKMVGVMERLSALPDDAYAERVELQHERERLRNQAAVLREGAAIDRVSLEAELAGLIARWESLQGERIDVVTQSGGSYGGDTLSGMHAMELNRQIDASHGRDRIEARIAEIRHLLAKQD